MQTGTLLLTLLAQVLLLSQGLVGDDMSCTVRLVAGVAAVRPGETFPAGVHLRLPKDAYVYWVNPGDSGMPTSVFWDLPEGFKAGPLRWPAPAMFVALPLVSFGYKDEVVFAAQITPPADLVPGKTVRLAARVEWLLCREGCVPGEAAVELVLPVRAEVSDDSADAALLERFVSRLPSQPAGWHFAVSDQGASFLLQARAEPGAVSITLEDYIFVPRREDLAAPAAPQHWLFTAAGGTLRIAKTPTRQKLAAGEILPGILLRLKDAGDGRDAWEIAPAVETVHIQELPPVPRGADQE